MMEEKSLPPAFRYNVYAYSFPLVAAFREIYTYIYIHIHLYVFVQKRFPFYTQFRTRNILSFVSTYY